MCLVSVIIPTYNRAHLLDISVKSVLNQTLKDFELIIVDDGSKDDTKDKVQSFNDAQIKYVYKNNSGVSASRNVGINAAKGKYIAFLDDDDSWPDNYLERMTSELEQKKGFGLAYCRTVAVRDGVIADMKDANRYVSGNVTVDIFQTGFVSPVACVVERKIFNKIWYDEVLDNSEDSDFFLRLSVYTNYLFIEDLVVEINYTVSSLSSKVDCNRIRSLDRFYFKLGGRDIIPVKIANKKFSRSYHQTAKKYIKIKNYKAASHLFFKSICFCPYDGRLYLKFITSKILSFFYISDWQMPQSLGMPVATNIVGQETLIND